MWGTKTPRTSEDIPLRGVRRRADKGARVLLPYIAVSTYHCTISRDVTLKRNSEASHC
jgi:hypothetical protein